MKEFTTPHLYAALLMLLPLIGFIINGLGFRKIKKGIAGTIGISACIAAFGFALGLFSIFKANGSQAMELCFFHWIPLAEGSIDFAFYIDQLTLTMLLIITGVGSLIHIYSASYMSHDEGFGKFFAYLNLFIFSMLVLVLGSNYVVMFAGWEGVGLCSYLLIGFWNKNTEYNNAARKAFIMNRIGDLGFLLGVFLIIAHFGSASYTDINKNAASLFAENDLTLIAITMLLFIGAMGKSAQIPLFTWLPDAMAGPTPVSALIHAATMVTAGIYMVIRSNALYSLAPATLEFVAIIGSLTALLGAIIGLKQNDIKKVLAYSTVSQLGYMFLALGVGAYSASLFHVMTHAFFKALMFLGAGSVIHAIHNQQDMRYMGGLRKYMPITFFTFIIGTLAISGIPPFSGFFSKDEILLNAFLHNKVLWAIGLASSALTAYYMFRLILLTFFGEFRGTEEQKHHLHESPLSMTIPLIVLAILSAIGGFMNIPHALGGDAEFADWLNPVLNGQMHTEVDASLELILMAVSVGVAVIGIVAAFVTYSNGKNVPADDASINKGFLSRLVYNKFYVDEAYTLAIVQPLGILSYAFHFLVDYFIIDLAVNIVAKSIQVLGRGLRYIQSGSIGVYMFAMVAGIVLIIMVSYFYLPLNQLTN